MVRLHRTAQPMVRVLRPLLAKWSSEGQPVGRETSLTTRALKTGRWVLQGLIVNSLLWRLPPSGAAVAIHILALWVTSPPDVVDAFLFRSPTPFSAWGVVARWAVFAVALVAALRRRLRLKPMVWRLCHVTLVTVVVFSSVVHAMLIEGTTGTASKAVLCMLVIAAVVKVTVDLRSWTLLTCLWARSPRDLASDSAASASSQLSNGSLAMCQFGMIDMAAFLTWPKGQPFSDEPIFKC